MRAGADSKQYTRDNEPERASGSAQHAAVSQCPYLGIVDDPATAFAFATPANHCFSSRRPDTIELHHQQSFCLTDRHMACPLYQEAINNAHGSAPVQSNERMPAAVGRLRKALTATLPGSTVPMGGVLASMLFALLLFGLIYIGLDRTNVLSNLGGGSDNGIVENPVAEAPTTDQPLVVLDADSSATPSPSPTTAPPTPTRPVQAESSRESEPFSTQTATANPSMTPTATAEPTETSSPTPTATEATPTATATHCSPPSGWVTYVVQPGENLYRIGLRYNLSASTMMEANCLSSASVYTGQTLYVPLRTPVNSASPTPVEPAPTSEPPPPPEPTATSEPPPPPPPPPPEDTATPPPPPPTATPPIDNPPPTPTAPLPSD